MSSLQSRRSKDDSGSLIYNLGLTSQFTSHLTSPSSAYIHSPYLSRKQVYAEAAASYPKFGFEPIPYEWYQHEELRGPVIERLMRDRGVHRPLDVSEAREITRRAFRKSNIMLRIQAMDRMGKKGNRAIELSSMTDLGNNVDEWSKRISRQTEDTKRRNNGAQVTEQPTKWLGRTSRMRNSGHLARWAGRLSATTVGGFAGGGVPRPERDNPLGQAIVEKPIRISVPPGLMYAAAKVVAETMAEAQTKEPLGNEGVQTKMPEPEVKRQAQAPNVRYRTVNKGRSSRFRTQTAAKSKLQSYRRIHGQKSLLPPPQHPCQVTSTNMDLLWSTASSIVSASSQNEADSDTGSGPSSEEEPTEESSSKDELHVASADKRSTTEPTTSSSPDISQANDTPFVGSSTKFRPPWAFPVSDDEALLDPDSWPEPDHRYTHLGPGRGKATRHLEAVSQMGFAGGGLRRPRTSDVLPPLPMAGGGTVGRVMAVPDGLRVAAEELQKKRVKHAEERADAHAKAAGVPEDEEKKAKKVREAVESEREETTVKADEVMESTGAREETKDERKARMIEKLFRHLEEAEADHIKGRKIARVSKTRDIGHNTRWARRISVTTASGFAGGGVPRPARDVVLDVDDDGWVGWKGKTKVPEGLTKAAQRREEKAPVEAKWEDPEDVSWPVKMEGGLRKEEWNVKWTNWEEAYWGEMASRKFEVIEPVPVEEADKKTRQHLGTEEPTAVKVGIIKRAHGMSKYESILSAALFVLAVLYAWELRGKYTT